MPRGIYVVANQQSEKECLNLLRSIRLSGCQLPVQLIPFGGAPVASRELLGMVTLREIASFPDPCARLLEELHQTFPDVTRGSLARFAAWFGEWDEFIYTDNDVVALTDWESLFAITPQVDLLHADEEYKTGGKFNFSDPAKGRQLLGDDAIDRALTSGHFLCRRREKMIDDLFAAPAWFRLHGGCTCMQDQVYLLVAALLGGWSTRNLCQPPDDWLSSWAGDYPTTLHLVQKIAAGGEIAHLHYSGGTSRLLSPIEELTLSYLPPRERLDALFAAAVGHRSGWYALRKLPAKILRRLPF